MDEYSDELFALAQIDTTGFDAANGPAVFIVTSKTMIASMESDLPAKGGRQAKKMEMLAE